MSNTVNAVLILASLSTGARVLLIQLKAGFNKPYGIGGGASTDSGDSGGTEVNQRGFLTAVETFSDNTFAIAVSVEVDRSGGGKGIRGFQLVV